MDDAAAARRDWLGVLAKAPAAALTGALDALGPRPAFAWLRAPEIGAVMVRGRAGGVGAAFNLGEMTVTRASLRLEDGAVGHAMVAGRDRAKAEAVALCDALLQGPRAPEVMARVVAPMAQAREAARAARAGEAAATKVDFFTVARGED